MSIPPNFEQDCFNVLADAKAAFLMADPRPHNADAWVQGWLSAEIVNLRQQIKQLTDENKNVCCTCYLDQLNMGS